MANKYSDVINRRLEYLYEGGRTPSQTDETIVEIMNYLLRVKRDMVQK